MTRLRVIPLTPEVGTQYVYTSWHTGRRWACHAKSPFEWARSYGFVSKADADRWGAAALEEFIRNDHALGLVDAVGRGGPR